jgi:hypothetical protein
VNRLGREPENAGDEHLESARHGSVAAGDVLSDVLPGRVRSVGSQAVGRMHDHERQEGQGSSKPSRDRVLSLRRPRALRVLGVHEREQFGIARQVRGVSGVRQGDRVGELKHVSELLARAGAKMVGRRADCPDCGGRRTVAVSESEDVFHCHHAGCGFSGGVGALRKRLGLLREWIPAQQYRRVKQAERMAERLDALRRKRRHELIDELNGLNFLERQVGEASEENAAFWPALRLIHTRRPQLLAELTLVEDAPTSALVRYVYGSAKQRAAAVDAVLRRGGISDASGRFREASCF